MLVEKFKLRMDKDTDAASASGYGTTETETSTDAKASEASGNNTDKANNDQKKAEGDQGKADSEDKSKQAAASGQQESKKIPDITGYNTDGTKKQEGSEGDASKDADAQAAEDKAKVTDDKPLELDLKGFKDEEVKDLRDFATAHKLTKEQAQALVDKRKESIDAHTKAQADAQVEVQNTYKKWEKELREDPDFGGKKFAANVHNVNKLLTDFMPDSTKLLTEQGRRISPIQMKEFAKLAAKLYGEGEHFDGSGGGKPGEERKPWDSYSN